MSAIHYRYSESELKKILSTLEIIVDTREQKNQHVLDYLRKKKVPFKTRTMKTGDYSVILIRASQNPFVLIVEDAQGYQKILKGEYRSQYKPESLLGSLKTFEVRYGFSIVYIPAATTGNYIYHHFLYMARELLKRGVI
ncbi:nuclease [Bacillus thuringiensis]|uniref:ERCC4 domain-containing protein n=1 Tax=Bacillus thuringiensis TaxID=1428 RepID=UPI00333DBF5A